MFPILSLIIWISTLSGIALLFIKGKHPRIFALIITIATLALSLFLLVGFNSQSYQMSWVELHPWIEHFNIYYSLGVDGFSLPLIILTCFMTLIVVIASYHSVNAQINQYLSAFLIMQGLICGALSSIDGILFYTFWEGMLIPMFLIIGIWGGPNRIYATLKFFLYTFLGSVLFLVALIYLHIKASELGLLNRSFDIIQFHQLSLTFIEQKWLFFAFLVAFAVKVPMWPVHTWLPDAHVEAPTGGSVILAAILLKMGGYGFLRFILPIVPDAAQAFAIPMIILSLIAVIYIGWVTIAQQDMKKLIAYSSVSHMGFVTLGFFIVFGIALNSNLNAAQGGIQGAMVQMISHGFVSAALFLCVGVLYDRLHSRLIKDYGGVVNSMPLFASFFMLFAMANVGLPGTSGFVGEFLIILSAFKANVWFSILAASILIWGASYTLWMFKRVVFGGYGHAQIAALPDLKLNEKIVFWLLALALLWLGLWPLPLLDLMQGSTTHLVEQMMSSKL